MCLLALWEHEHPNPNRFIGCRGSTQEAFPDKMTMTFKEKVKLKVKNPNKITLNNMVQMIYDVPRKFDWSNPLKELKMKVYDWDY